MSRTTLCMLTASVLAALSLGTMALRFHVLGEEVRRPIGPGTWKIALAVQGTSTGQGRVWTAMPLSTEKQHLIEDRHTQRADVAPPAGRTPPGAPARRVGAPGPARPPARSSCARNSSSGCTSAGRPAQTPSPLDAAPGQGAVPRQRAADRGERRAHHGGGAPPDGATSARTPAPSTRCRRCSASSNTRSRCDVRLDGPAVSAATALEQGSGDRCAAAGC